MADRSGGAAVPPDAPAPLDRSQGAALAAASVLSFVLSIVVSRTLFPLLSGNLDEGVYLFQGEMLRSGLLTLPEATHGEWFRPWLSGTTDTDIFTQYQPGLPAYLALWGALGATRLGLALLAPALVVATWALTRELFGRPWVALGAAAAVGLSPIFVWHSALVLTYQLTSATVVGAAALALAAERTRRPAPALAAGTLAAVAILTRPLDAALFLGPFAVLVVVRWFGSGERTVPVRLVALAATPVALAVVLLGAYNTATTGSPTRFPNMAADPLNGFGFGTRRLLPTEPTIDYELGDALAAAQANLAAVPSWLLGGGLALVAAAAGVALAWHHGQRAEGLTLTAAALAFPAGYLLWWATRLSAIGAVDGIGPHYYVPGFVPLVVLAAYGASYVPRRTAVIVPVALVATGLTVANLPGKITSAREVTAVHEQVRSLVPDDLDGAVVLVDTGGKPYAMSRFPFLRPDPRLDAPVLWAADHGTRTPLVAEQFPDRSLHRLRIEGEATDADPFDPSGGWTDLTATAGDVLELEVVVGRDHPWLTGRSAGDRYLRVGDDEVARWQAERATFTLAGSPPADVVVTDDVELVVGVELVGPDGSIERVEQRIPVAIGDDGRRWILTPGPGWREVVFPDTSAWFAVDTAGLLDVSAT